MFWFLKHLNLAKKFFLLTACFQGTHCILLSSCFSNLSVEGCGVGGMVLIGLERKFPLKLKFLFINVLTLHCCIHFGCLHFPEKPLLCLNIKQD